MNKPSTMLCISLLLCVVVQLVSRYAAAPVTDFVLDDWACLAEATSYPDYHALARASWMEKNRPLILFSTIGLFKALGDHPAGYAWVSMFIYSLIMVLYGWMMYELTRSWLACLLSGVIFAVLPNLTESFHWGQLTAMAWIYLAHLCMLIGWIRYLQAPRLVYLLTSLLGYGLCLFAYELFFAIPFALLMLVPVADWRRVFKRWLLFPVLALVYLLWRFSMVFGTKYSIQSFDSSLRGFDLSGIAWNARQLVGWWLGDNFLQSIAQGLMSFIAQPAGKLYALLVLNLAVIGALAWVVRHYFRRGGEIAPMVAKGNHHPVRIFLFFVVWAGLAAAPSLISWTSGRQNYLVAMGVAGALGYACSLMDRRVWLSGWLALSALFLCVNQGTNLQWKHNGVFNRALFLEHERSMDAWQGRSILFYDSSELRKRMSFGLSGQERAVFGMQGRVMHGNAEVIRGFVPYAMVKLLAPDTAVRVCLLDVETGAFFNDGIIYWHNRFNSTIPHFATQEEVFVFDLGKIAR